MSIVIIIIIVVVVSLLPYTWTRSFFRVHTYSLSTSTYPIGSFSLKHTDLVPLKTNSLMPTSFANGMRKIKQDETNNPKIFDHFHVDIYIFIVYPLFANCCDTSLLQCRPIKFVGLISFYKWWVTKFMIGVN